MKKIISVMLMICLSAGLVFSVSAKESENVTFLAKEDSLVQPKEILVITKKVTTVDGYVNLKANVSVNFSTNQIAGVTNIVVDTVKVGVINPYVSGASITTDRTRATIPVTYQFNGEPVVTYATIYVNDLL